MKTQNKMPVKTLRALKKSVEHWERLAAGTSTGDEFIFNNDCALCKLFDRFPDCAGCPVSKRSGVGDCKGTPWQEVSAAFIHARLPRSRFKESPKFKTLAQNQLAFLKSLLPKDS